MIDEFEALVASGRGIPLLGKVILNKRRLLSLIDQMRLAVPEDVLKAERLLRDKESLISQTRLEAERIIKAAEEESRARIEGSDFVKLAQQRAQELMDEVEKEALAKREGADQYTLEVLRRLDSELGGILASVRKGIEALEREKPASSSS